MAGDGTAAIPNTLVGDHAFTGGADAAELDAVYDHPGKDGYPDSLDGATLAQVVTYLDEHELDADTRLRARFIYGSNLAGTVDNAPQTIPFSRIYANAGQPEPLPSQL